MLYWLPAALFSIRFATGEKTKPGNGDLKQVTRGAPPRTSSMAGLQSSTTSKKVRSILRQVAWEVGTIRTCLRLAFMTVKVTMALLFKKSKHILHCGHLPKPPWSSEPISMTFVPNPLPFSWTAVWSQLIKTQFRSKQLATSDAATGTFLRGNHKSTHPGWATETQCVVADGFAFIEVIPRVVYFLERPSLVEIGVAEIISHRCRLLLVKGPHLFKDEDILWGFVKPGDLVVVDEALNHRGLRLVD